jgi:hypothetical protein
MPGTDGDCIRDNTLHKSSYQQNSKQATAILLCVQQLAMLDYFTPDSCCKHLAFSSTSSPCNVQQVVLVIHVYTPHRIATQLFLDFEQLL